MPHLQNLVWLLIESETTLRILIIDQDFIAKLDSVLELKYQHCDFGVRDLARELNISRSQLHRKITVSLGVSASTYLNEFRLRKALLLLQQGSLNASDVAYEVGFSSPSYFSTCFKKYYAFTPTQVRSGDHKSLTNDGSKTAIKRHESPHPVAQDTFIKRKSIINSRHFPSIIFVGICAFILVGSLSWASLTRSSDLEKVSLLDHGEKSIAVLPFKNYSSDSSLEIFCAGMTDDIISKLTTIESFDRVISRTSSQKFGDTKISIPEIASELKVTYILEGNIQKEDEEFKVNIQLIDARKDDHITTNQYAGHWNSKEIFKIQEDISTFVAERMQVAVSVNEAIRLQKYATHSKQAYDLYQQAKFHLYSGDEESADNARQFLEEAIYLDSTFAEAYSSLGSIWLASGLGEGWKDQKLSWERAKFYLEKAQKLDPFLKDNELYLLQGYFYYDWNFDPLEKFMLSRFSEYHYNRETAGLLDYAIKTGRFEQALETTERSLEVDPLDAVLYSFKARALWFLEREEEAVAILNRMDKLNKNDWFYLKEATHNYFMMEEYDRSKQALDLVMERFQDRSPILIWLKAIFAHWDTNFHESKLYLDELHTAYKNAASGGPAWYIARYYLTVEKDKSKFFDWLEKSFERREVALTWLHQEPSFEPIRDDPRYLVLHKKIGFANLTLVDSKKN